MRKSGKSPEAPQQDVKVWISFVQPQQPAAAGPPRGWRNTPNSPPFITMQEHLPQGGCFWPWDADTKEAIRSTQQVQDQVSGTTLAAKLLYFHHFQALVSAAFSAQTQFCWQQDEAPLL